MEAILLTPQGNKTTRHTLLVGDQVTLIEETKLELTEDRRQALVTFLNIVKADMGRAHRATTTDGRITFSYTPSTRCRVPDIHVYNSTRLVAALSLYSAWRLLAELVTYETLKTEEIHYDK